MGYPGRVAVKINNVCLCLETGLRLFGGVHALDDQARISSDHPHRPTDQGSRGSKQIGLLGTETPFLAALLVVLVSLR
jgi:hypothetical protein